MRNLLRYVLGNSRKHELERTGRSQIPALSDPHKSALWFEELLDPYEDFPPGEPPIARARTWMLRVGWRKSGPLSLSSDQDGRGSPLAPLRRQHRQPPAHRC